MKSAEPSRRLALALLAATCLLAWGGSLASRAWVRDDRALVLENPLLRARALKPLLLGGYHQAVMGDAAPIHQWRPVLSLSFLAQTALTGFSKPPLHAVNVLLHLLTAFLLHEALRRRFDARAALAGALLWSVLPVHAESVVYLTSRSEQLAAAGVLGAWLLLEAPARPGAARLAAGTLVYVLGSLSKEHALLFPLLLALADWTYAGLLPWSPSRRRAHLALAAAGGLVLLGRALILPGLAVGGTPYFAADTNPLARLLTLAKFWALWYARPALTGTGLCFDVSRPFFPDAGAGDAVAWLCLLALLCGLALAARALAARRAWGFWVLGPLLFLLPTSHLIMELDTLGAQRFLYIPSMTLAAAAAMAYARARARAPRSAFAAAAALLLAATGRAAAQTATWLDEERLYRAALACNPRSPALAEALGVALLRSGQEAEGESRLREAAQAGNWAALYDLARLAHGRGRREAARANLRAALALKPDAPDALTLAGLLAEEDGRWGQAAAAYAAAARARPHDPIARWNHARALARLNRPGEAAAELEAYLRLVPDDEEARRWRARLP